MNCLYLSLFLSSSQVELPLRRHLFTLIRSEIVSQCQLQADTTGLLLLLPGFRFTYEMSWAGIYSPAEKPRHRWTDLACYIHTGICVGFCVPCVSFISFVDAFFMSCVNQFEVPLNCCWKVLYKYTCLAYGWLVKTIKTFFLLLLQAKVYMLKNTSATQNYQTLLNLYSEQI